MYEEHTVMKRSWTLRNQSKYIQRPCVLSSTFWDLRNWPKKFTDSYHRVKTQNRAKKQTKHTEMNKK